MDGPFALSKRTMNLCVSLFKERDYGFEKSEDYYHLHQYYVGSEYSFKIQHILQEKMKSLMLTIMPEEELTLEISGYEIEGEGEMKMFQALELEENANFEHIYLVSDDSDAIILGILRCEEKRLEQQKIPPKKLYIKHQGDYVNLNDVVEDLISKHSSKSNRFQFIDALLLGCLTGNDILPKPKWFFLRSLQKEIPPIPNWRSLSSLQLQAFLQNI